MLCIVGLVLQCSLTSAQFLKPGFFIFKFLFEGCKLR